MESCFTLLIGERRYKTPLEVTENKSGKYSWNMQRERERERERERDKRPPREADVFNNSAVNEKR